MIRTFIEVPIFTKRWKEIGLGDDTFCDTKDEFF